MAGQWVHVDFYAPRTDPVSYVYVASVTVQPDGSYSYDDPEGRLPFSTPVVTEDSVLDDRLDTPAGGVRFVDDPWMWARYVPTALRTAYVRAVVSTGEVA